MLVFGRRHFLSGRAVRVYVIFVCSVHAFGDRHFYFPSHHAPRARCLAPFFTRILDTCCRVLYFLCSAVLLPPVLVIKSSISRSTTFHSTWFQIRTSAEPNTVVIRSGVLGGDLHFPLIIL